MNKKILMIATSLSLIMMAVSTLTVQKIYADEVNPGTILDQVKCYCTRTVHFETKGCRVDGASGVLCAQSQPGGNILCHEYDSNCK